MHSCCDDPHAMRTPCTTTISTMEEPATRIVPEPSKTAGEARRSSQTYIELRLRFVFSPRVTARLSVRVVGLTVWRPIWRNPASEAALRDRRVWNARTRPLRCSASSAETPSASFVSDGPTSVRLRSSLFAVCEVLPHTTFSSREAAKHATGKQQPGSRAQRTPTVCCALQHLLFCRLCR